jgi:hypothetical protein
VDQALATCGQVLGHPRGVQRQRIQINHVDVGPLSDFDDALMASRNAWRDLRLVHFGVD